MSLNSGIMDDIQTENGIDLSNSVAFPDEKTTGPEMIVNVDTRDTFDHDTSLSDKEIKTLPDLAVKVRLLSDRGAKIVDMKDVQADIESGDTMSRNKANVVEATFANFTNSANPIGGYTTLESRTNLLFTTNFMKKRIQVSLEALSTDLSAFNDEDLPLINKVMGELKDTQVGNVKAKIINSVEIIEALAPTLTASRNLVLPFTGNRFQNLSKCDLTQVHMLDLDKSVPLNNEFTQAFNEMVRSWKNVPSIRILYESLSSGEDVTVNDLVNKVGPKVRELTLSVVITMFIVDNAKCIYTKLADAVDSSVYQTQTAMDLSSTSTKSTQAAADFITKDADGFAGMIDNVDRLGSILAEVSEFAENCAKVVTGLASLK